VMVGAADEAASAVARTRRRRPLWPLTASSVLVLALALLPTGANEIISPPPSSLASAAAHAAASPPSLPEIHANSAVDVPRDVGGSFLSRAARRQKHLEQLQRLHEQQQFRRKVDKERQRHGKSEGKRAYFPVSIRSSSYK